METWELTIKDLIDRFESPSTPSIRRSISSPGTELDHEFPKQIPYPARFLSHNHLLEDNTWGPPPQEASLPQSLLSQDITEATESRRRKYPELDGLPSPSNSSGKSLQTSDEDRRPLLSRVMETTRNNRHRHSQVHSYYHPVSSAVVFARKSHPLYLPQLDKFLASLQPPVFRYTFRSEMFPPMGRLVDSGKSLDDLEVNSTVVPAWRNRKTILGSIVSIVLGLTGSSLLASYYSLQGLMNTVQVFALILSTIVPVDKQDLGDEWRALFLGTIPNILALNFASTLVEALMFLLIFMAIAAALLLVFYRSIHQSDRYGIVEGFQQTPPKGSQWGLVLVTFLLTVIYLPLSTMTVHILVWSQDLWVVPNPYTNATSYPPIVLPLGPPSEYRDALDFCWTTTMKKNQVNYAPVLVILAGIVFTFLTIWFPLTLRRLIKLSAPKVDRFTELGRLRNNTELDAEYHRLLSRDQNPFAFLYSGFRRGWATYESTYLGAKFSTLLIIAVIDPNNCLFRSVSRSLVPVVRQITLVLCTFGFFLAQCIYAPFLDPVNNASEWTSRVNYLSTSIVALVVALDISSTINNIFNTYVLYTIYIVTYSMTFYFTIINLGPIQRFLKRFTRRIDFSIDIFSPRLDVTISSPHLRRRIWQESITTLLLTAPDCAIPKEQIMAYAQARNSEFPPYLLNFRGTPGERHVENLKILREVGTLLYNKAAALTTGTDHNLYRQLQQQVQRHFVGPDCYWKNPASSGTPGCKNYFGNAWWIPFPPTLVLQYDDGPLVTLMDLADLEIYILQNSSLDISRRRLVRLSIRALEGQTVLWPYDHILPIGTHSNWFGKKQYEARKPIHYRSCTLLIKRRGYLVWDGLRMGSGFDVELQYAKKVLVPGEEIGLNDDYDLTASLAQFFQLNRTLISERMPYIERTMDNYRRYNRKVGRWKSGVLSYRFLSNVYDHPRNPSTLTAYALNFERDPRVRAIIKNCEVELTPAYERWLFVSQSETRAWWYLFWDDLWRRNYATYSGLRQYASDFNPYYSTSIAYIPLPRAALESFLGQRGLFSKRARQTELFTPGFLNKIYLRLNDTVFRFSSKEIKFHVGEGTGENMMDVDLEFGEAPSMGTGAGTNYDESRIQMRPQYHWEGLLDTPHGGTRRKKFFSKLAAWLGWAPTWRSGIPSNDISLDVKLEDGRFVLLHGSNMRGV